MRTLFVAICLTVVTVTINPSNTETLYQNREHVFARCENVSLDIFNSKSCISHKIMDDGDLILKMPESKTLKACIAAEFNITDISEALTSKKQLSFLDPTGSVRMKVYELHIYDALEAKAFDLVDLRICHLTKGYGYSTIRSYSEINDGKRTLTVLVDLSGISLNTCNSSVFMRFFDAQHQVCEVLPTKPDSTMTVLALLVLCPLFLLAVYGMFVILQGRLNLCK